MGVLHAKVISELVLPVVSLAQWQCLSDYVFGEIFK